MNTEPYDRMHHNVYEALHAMRNVREVTLELTEVQVRTGKIKAESWKVDQALDKLSHAVFLHQKQTRRALGR